MTEKLEFYRRAFGLTRDELDDLILKHNGDLRLIIDEIISVPPLC